MGSQSVDYNTKIWGETSISFFTHIQMKEEPLHLSYNHIFIEFLFLNKWKGGSQNSGARFEYE